MTQYVVYQKNAFNTWHTNIFLQKRLLLTEKKSVISQYVGQWRDSRLLSFNFFEYI